MRKILIITFMTLASLSAGAVTAADFFFPADTTLVHYSPNAIFNGQIDSIVTKVAKPYDTADLYKMTRRNLIGETVGDKIQFTDSTVVIGAYYYRSNLDYNAGGRGRIFYDHEILRIPRASDSASWTAYNSISQNIYVSKFERVSKFVTLRLTMPGLLTGVILTFVPSMGLFFIADILGGNKIVLLGNVIQEQLMKVHDWPFAAALSVVMMAMTSVLIWIYRRVSGTSEMEGML